MRLEALDCRRRFLPKKVPALVERPLSEMLFLRRSRTRYGSVTILSFFQGKEVVAVVVQAFVVLRIGVATGVDGLGRCKYCSSFVSRSCTVLMILLWTIFIEDD